MTFTEKYDWIFCCLLEQDIFYTSRNPFTLGMYEFTRFPDPMPGCEDALKASAKAYSYSLSGKEVRVRCFFLNTSETEAIKSGRLFAKETISLYSQIDPFGRAPLLSKVGYLFNLSKGQALPILPQKLGSFVNKDNPLKNTTVFILDDIATHPNIILNSLLSTPPDVFGELGGALRRSSHWKTIATQVDDVGEKLLLLWMTAETLTKVDEREDLIPKFLASLGFPKSQYFLRLPDSEKYQLNKLRDFKYWQKKLTKLFKELKIVRNHIVHSGYREIEIFLHFSDDDFHLIKRSLHMLVISLQRLALNALELRIKTIKEMWNRYNECIMLYRTINLAEDLKGNIIYRLNEKEDVFDD